MKNGSLDTLTRGIKLENSETILPWRSTFENLKRCGNPEVRKRAGIEMIVWKNEKILDGLTVDLNVICSPGLCSGGQKLHSVSAYISESEFERARGHFNRALKKDGKFERLNDVEFSYTWKVKNCVVMLSHLDRFGSFWKLDIKRRFSLLDLLQPLMSGRGKIRVPGFRQDIFLSFNASQLQPLLLRTV